MTLRRYEPSLVPFMHQLRERWFQYDALVKLLDNLLASARCKNILSLGCGTGSVEHRLVQRGYKVTGSDIDDTAVAFAREMNKESYPGLLFEVRDMFEISKSDCFDAVLLLYTELPGDDICHLLRRLHEIIRPGGLFLVNLSVSAPITLGSTTCGFELLEQGAIPAVCISTYTREASILHGTEIYMISSDGGKVSIVKDYTHLPINYWNKVDDDSGFPQWIPVGWQLKQNIDLDEVCPTAAPPFCQQRLLVFARKNINDSDTGE